MTPVARSLNILLVADEGAGVEVLKDLVDGPHRIAGVLASPPEGDRPASAPWRFAQKLGLPTIPARSVKDPAFAATIAGLGVDLLLNVHSLYILRREVVEAPRIGSYNLHPGPLPRYAGLNAPSWAIYRGEAEHGVTVHRMEPGVDTGPIAYQERFPIGPEDTGLTVSLRCTRAGLGLLRRLVEDAAAGPGAIPERRQDPSAFEYFGPETPQGGAIRWSAPARSVLDLVRAADFGPYPSPWGTPRAALRGQAVAVPRASRLEGSADAPPGTATAVDRSGACVACGDGGRVLLPRLHVDGRDVAAVDILRPGDRLDDGAPAPGRRPTPQPERTRG